jgi:pyridinium-3,5-biscarboxylic acid mononucleotide sulfurtransferase
MASLTIDWEGLPHKDKFDQLFGRFRELKQAMVAYSGGVDSTLLLKVGTLALGDRCVGVTALSETLTPEEYEAALAIARDHAFNIRTVQYSELEIENYAENPTNRCYFCKHELFGRLRQIAQELGIDTLIDGTNADDVDDWRPGMQAAQELRVVSLLREADLHKSEIRELCRALRLPNWDKPSAPCLSSRIAYGIQIDKQKLDQVAEGERFLRQNGFRVVRVRHHGEIARIEVAPEELARLVEPELRERITARLRELGFRYVTLDLIGYRTGSLNESFTRPGVSSQAK